MKGVQPSTGSARSVAKLIVFALLWLMAGTASALDADGCSATLAEARHRAAAELVTQIQVRVQSVVEACTRVSGRQAEDCGSRVMRRTAADLPLLGLRYPQPPGGTERHGARAMLEGPVALPLYRRKLNELNAEFTAASTVLESAKEGRQLYELIGRPLATRREILDHGLVAAALGDTVVEAPGSEAALLAQRARLEQSVDSMGLAAHLLLEDVDGTLASFQPVLSGGSHEVTDFSAAFSQALLAEGGRRAGAALTAKGDYRLVEGGQIEVVLELRRRSEGGIAAVRTVRLHPQAFAGLEVKPRAPSLENILRAGMVTSNEFKVELATDRGGRELLLRAGETVRLLVRSNEPVYYYIVGNVVLPDGQFAYLLPLIGNPADDPAPEGWAGQADRFVRYLPPTSGNHHEVIGEFEVQQPFGIEHLQVFASTQRFDAAQLPRVRYHRNSGYYDVEGSEGNVTQAVAHTRALVVKKRDQKNSSVVEATLSYTTKPR